MRWSTSWAGWSRREAVLTTSLGGGAALAALAVPFDAPWLIVAGVIVAAVGSGVRLVIAVQRARTEHQREEVVSARLLRDRIAPVASVDPTLLGVEPAEQTILPGGAVPDYVARANDQKLDRALVAALDGAGPRIVVVEGPSKVGKSRSLFEALRRCDRVKPLELAAPVNGDESRSSPICSRAPKANRPRRAIPCAPGPVHLMTGGAEE